MAEIFNANRFGRLWRAHWADHGRGYARFFLGAMLLDLVLLAIATIILDRPNRFDSLRIDAQMMWYYVGLFATGAIFVNRHFSKLGSAGATLLHLMQPASILEKTILSFGVLTVVFPLLYTAAYLVLHAPVVLWAKAHIVLIPNEQETIAAKAELIVYYPLRLWLESRSPPSTETVIRGEWVAWLYFIYAQALVACGYLRYSRLPAIKTSILIFGLFLLFLIVTWSKKFFPTMVFSLGGWAKADALLSGHEHIVAGVVALMVPILIWVANYLFLAEREVQ